MLKKEKIAYLERQLEEFVISKRRAYITNKELAEFLGFQDPSSVRHITRPLAKHGISYLIPEVAEQLVETAKYTGE